MRHVGEGQPDEYAIHEVYLNEKGEVVTYTREALSPRVLSVEALEAVLERLLAGEGNTVRCGDLGQVYDKATVEDWLSQIHRPVIDYPQVG